MNHSRPHAAGIIQQSTNDRVAYGQGRTLRTTAIK